MKSIKRISLHCLLIAYATLPVLAHSDPGELATKPLWLTDAFKHNIILALDDSGSMDSEVLFSANDGAAYIDTDTGLFTDSNGVLNESGSKYVYLFPNGRNGSYDGRTMMNTSNHFSIPPIKAYAFARYAGINTAYYNPDVTYEPWPSISDHTFTDADVSATRFEPYTGTLSSGNTATGTINLFTNLNTSVNGIDWGFDIQDDDMVCDDTGGTCATGETHFTYYPATYYVKDTTSSYTYTPPTHSGNSVLLEAEDATASLPMRTNATLALSAAAGDEATALADATAGASGNSFVGTLDSDGDSLDFIPLDLSGDPEGGLSFTFTQPTAGTSKVWLRVYARDGSHDSFWLRMQGYGSADVTLANLTDVAWDGDWNKFWRNFPIGEWGWIEWGELNLTAGSHTFEVLRREGGTYVDQILITTETDYVPSDAESLGTVVTRSCETDTAGSHYPNFARSPDSFEYVTGTIIDGVNRGGDDVDAIANDGSCLIKYEISGTDGNSFANGSAVSRTVAEEKQNFANWFSYYRRRHQAMRGGLATAFQGIGGIQTGLFWINDKSDVTMFDMEDFVVDGNIGTGEVDQFLTAHYSHVRGGGTPLRSALKYAGDQFKRTDATAPISLECQKNFTLMFTDGFNSETSVSDIANEDGSAGAPYADTYEDTLADIAYKYYTENLRPDLTSGQVGVAAECSVTPLDPSLDCNTNLHMNTYTVGLGAQGTIFGNTHFDADDAYASAPTWPNVNSARDARQIDDLYHAAVNGRGDMFSADTPEELGSKLSEALLSIISSIGSGGSVTFDSDSTETEGILFSALFNSTTWTGDLRAIGLNSDGSVQSGTLWEVASTLDARDLSVSPRTILTSDGSDGVPFQWASLTSDMQADLKIAIDGSTGTDAEGQARLNYLRGEGMPNASGDMVAPYNNMRKRTSRLGDIVHSGPVYVGIPGSGWPDADPFGTGGDANGVGQNRYSDFRNKAIADGGANDRTPMVYVGANDGMLHGFNGEKSSTSSGQEVMAYIPHALYSNTATEGLHYLTDPSYSHKYFVDLTPVAQDVYIDTTDPVSASSRDWATVLVGGFRSGARGLFALDITNPSSFSENATSAANTVLWEFTDAHDNDIGYLANPPIVALMENEKWAVIFANGYNSDNGLAKLFIAFIEEGLDGTWSTGDYIEIDTEVGSVSDKNGLSGVAVADVDGDRLADRVYAGDLKGNMWAFDLSSSNSNSWGVAYSQGGSPAPLFAATDSSGNAQPITAPANLAFNTTQVDSGNEPNVLVTFGTGRYLTNGAGGSPVDASDKSTQSYYTIWDKGNKSLARSDLSPRTLDLTGNTISIATGAAVDWTSEYGWNFDFSIDANGNGQVDTAEQEGERLINKPQLVSVKDIGPVAIFATIIPNDSDCSGGGVSSLYGIPLFTGQDPETPILILDDVGIGERKDVMINEVKVRGDDVYLPDVTGNVSQEECDCEGGSSREGRLGWHELIEK